MSNQVVKSKQLGMNHSTAAHRLRADVLFMLVTSLGFRCYRCDEELTRDTFSIEHKEPWLHSDDPVGRFFDLDNIAFSHQECNYRAGQRPGRRYHTDEDRREAKNRVNREYRARLDPEEVRRRRRVYYRAEQQRRGLEGSVQLGMALEEE